jgi:hypothetical protein
VAGSPFLQNSGNVMTTTTTTMMMMMMMMMMKMMIVHNCYVNLCKGKGNVYPVYAMKPYTGRVEG